MNSLTKSLSCEVDDLDASRGNDLCINGYTCIIRLSYEVTELSLNPTLEGVSGQCHTDLNSITPGVLKF